MLINDGLGPDPQVSINGGAISNLLGSIMFLANDFSRFYTMGIGSFICVVSGIKDETSSSC